MRGRAGSSVEASEPKQPLNYIEAPSKEDAYVYEQSWLRVEPSKEEIPPNPVRWRPKWFLASYSNRSMMVRLKTGVETAHANSQKSGQHGG
jgi:hypothetical protein